MAETTNEQKASVQAEIFQRDRNVADQFLNSQVERWKQLLNFFDKLVVLNGATLALSFTAASQFATKGAKLSQHSDLRSGWICLIISITTSLFSSWVLMGGMGIRFADVRRKRLQENRDLAELIAKTLDIDPDQLGLRGPEASTNSPFHPISYAKQMLVLRFCSAASLLTYFVGVVKLASFLLSNIN